MKNLTLILAIVALALQLSLFVVLLSRKVYTSFPFFALYSGYAVVVGSVRFVAFNIGGPYATIFWPTEDGYTILIILAVYENF